MCLLTCNVLLYSLAGKVDFYAKRHGGGKSITARFPKRTEPILGSPHPSTTSEKAIALQRAKAFKSDNPFFMVSMGSTNIDGYHMVSFLCTAMLGHHNFC